MNRKGKKIIRRLRQRGNRGRGVRTSKSGHLYINCPFHTERTASFSIDLENGVYYCYGCLAKGTIYELAKYEPWILSKKWRPRQVAEREQVPEQLALPVEEDELPF